MRHRGVVATLIAFVVLLAPEFAWSEPGFSLIQSMPKIVGVSSYYSDAYSSLSCPSVASCTAVGSGGAYGVPSVITAVDGTWGEPVALPLPSNAGGPGAQPAPTLNSITCSAPADCVAVGSYPDKLNDETSYPLVETEVSGTWTASTIALPSGVTGLTGMSSIWCQGAGSCVTVGSFIEPHQRALPMAAVDTSGTWARAIALAVSPTIAPEGLGPFSLACHDVGDCAAIVEASLSGGGGTGIFQWTEAAGTWGAAAFLPQLSHSKFEFAGISAACPSATTCLLVGNLSTVGPTPHPVTVPAVMTETSGTWSEPHRLALPALSPVMTQGSLTSLACATSTLCEAVGTLATNSSDVLSRPGAVTWSNGSWSSLGRIRDVRLGTGLTDWSYLTAVSCGSATTCLAIGGDVENTAEEYSPAGAFSVDIVPIRQTTLPLPPTSIAVQVVPHGVTVRWRPPYDDGGASVTYFTVTISPGGGHCRTLMAYVCRIAGLVAGHRYRVSVRDATSVGSSPPTAPIVFTPPR